MKTLLVNHIELRQHMSYFIFEGGSWILLYIIFHIQVPGFFFDNDAFLIDIKYPMEITLCETDILILVTMIFIFSTQFLPSSEKQKLKWDFQSRKLPWGVLVKFEIVR